MRYVLVALVACAAPAPAPVAPIAVAEPASPWPVAVPLTGCSWNFTGVFKIGDSPFRLSIDTGSGLVAVAGSACTSCVAGGVAHLYSPGSGAIDLHHAETAAYDGGDMTWSGGELADVVGAGNASARVALYSIATQRRFFSRGGCGSADGILGLSGDGQHSWLAALAETGMPDVFAIHKCASDGTLWLGGYDAQTAPAWVQMVTLGGYRIGLDDVKLGGASLDLPRARYSLALVDSGGPRMFLPKPAFDAIVRTLADNATFRDQLGDPATWLERGECKSIALSRAQLDAALPPLTLVLDGATLEMRATDAYVSVSRWHGQVLYCPALRPGPGVDLGDRVMHSHTVIFDRAHGRMGFAPAPCGEP
jgi:hypothetical protein